MFLDKNFNVKEKQLKSYLDNSDPVAQWFTDQFKELNKKHGTKSTIAGGYLVSKINGYSIRDLDIFIHPENLWGSDYHSPDGKVANSQKMFADDVFGKNNWEQIGDNNGYATSWVVVQGDISGIPFPVQLIFHRFTHHLYFDLYCSRQYYTVDKKLTTNRMVLGHRLDNIKASTSIARLGKYAKRGIPIDKKELAVLAQDLITDRIKTKKLNSKVYNPKSKNFYSGWKILFEVMSEKEKKQSTNFFNAIEIANIKLADIDNVNFISPKHSLKDKASPNSPNNFNLTKLL